MLVRLGRGAVNPRWAVLLVLSALFSWLLELLHFPAAVLLGSMIAAIVTVTAIGTVRVSPLLFFLAQGVLGCLIARSVPLSIFAEIGRNWPIFLLGVASVVGAAATLGGVLTRWRVLPGTTAVWGSSPGAASAMTLMAEAYGADIRLVAFMQYIRVVCVAVVASLVSRFWVAGSGASAPAIVWFPAVDWTSLAETVALAVAGAVLGRRFRIPAGPMLVPLCLGILLQDTRVVTIELPPWLLAMSYALIGWNIGLGFTRSILAHAARAFPRVIASTLTLIAICGLFAVGLVSIVGLDPLTAYLAMSPGGLDSVAIIAASSTVNLPFVMAMQTARFLVVLLTGPSLARFIAKRAGGSKGSAGACNDAAIACVRPWRGQLRLSSETCEKAAFRVLPTCAERSKAFAEDRLMKKIGFLSFGHWSPSPQSATRSARDALLQSIDLAVAAEALGADGAYFRVHHFARQLASPFPLLAAIGARTSRIEIGTAVIDMRYENPLYMAEDAGAADLIGGGRLQLGISRGSPEQVIDGWRYFGYVPEEGQSDADMGRRHAEVLLAVLEGEGFAEPNPRPMFPNPPGLLRIEPHSEGLRERIWWGSASNATAVWAAQRGMNLQSSTLKEDETGEPFHVQQARQIRRYREAWKEAGHVREPRVSVSRSIFALVNDRDRAYFGRGKDSDQIGIIDNMRAIFGRSYAAEPDRLVEELKADEAIAEADTLLLTVPNQLGVDYNAHVIEAILKHVAPALGWR